MFALAINIPLMLLVCPLVGFFLGKYLEEIWPWAVYGRFGGLILGFAAGLLESYHLFKLISAMDMAAGQNRPQSKG